MATARSLTPTSFALLGLLAIKPWTTYELAQQMDFTLSRFWPRARSKLYEEPKKLVALGLATATKERTGRRPRTVYSITPAGRRALRRWLAEPGEGPVLEFEQLLQVFFAPSGTTTDLRRTLDAVRDWVEERTVVNVEVATAYRERRGEFEERSAVNQLVGLFLDDFLETLDRWATTALEVTERWPDDPALATPDDDLYDAALPRARARLTRLRSR